MKLRKDLFPVFQKLVSPFHKTLDSSVISQLFTKFSDGSELFRDTGSVHGAMLFDENFNSVHFFADLSRHNCIVKSAGFLIERRFYGLPYGIFLSCRVNTEIIDLIDKIGFSVVISRAAPTYDAVEQAKEKGIHLIAFTKEDRFSLFLP